MKAKQITIEEYKKSLKEQMKRAECFESILDYIESCIRGRMIPEVEKESWSEEYIDENGETKTKWHWAVYKEDEDGNTIYNPPTEDDYRYEDYVAWLKVKDEIMSML